jgi:hypothetical protein
MPKIDDQIFLREIYPKVEMSLKDKHNSDKLQKHITKFMDDNGDVLFHRSPSKRLYFKDKGEDKDIIFETSGLTELDISNAVKKSELIKASWRILNKPFNWAALLEARYYLLAGDEKSMYNVLMYLSFSFYASIHAKYFRVYLPNEDIMDYTINNLSNKFKIKQFGSLAKAVYDTMVVCHDKYKDDLKRGHDDDLKDYIMSLKKRLDSFVQNIFNEYRQNEAAKNYHSYQGDDLEGEKHIEQDNISFKISKIAEKAINLILTSGVDEKILNLAANMSNVSANVIKSAVYNIIGKKPKEIRQFVTLILQLYLIDGQNSVDSVSSSQFILVCLGNYSKSNTTNKNVLEMKEILDSWLLVSSEKYARTNRVASRSDFRKSIFLYFVGMIQRSVKD